MVLDNSYCCIRLVELQWNRDGKLADLWIPIVYSDVRFVYGKKKIAFAPVLYPSRFRPF
jgi:hypothetical protein